jgi:hypothetical protein
MPFNELSPETANVVKAGMSRKERLSLSLVAALLVGGEVTRDLIIDAEMPLRHVCPALYPLFKALMYSAHLWGKEDQDCAGFFESAILHLDLAGMIGGGALQFCPGDLDTVRRSFLPEDIEDVIHELKTGYRMTSIDFSESDIVQEDVTV